MKCLRCGYCCTSLLVVIVRDPDGPFDATNLMTVGTSGEKERCPHLRGDKVGMYECAVHDKEWYVHTPCAQYQEHFPERNCRMGEFLLSQGNIDEDR